MIPTFERPAFLQDALHSLATQLFTDLEVIVINDGGQSVASVVEPWRRRFPLTLIESDRRGGVSAARNAGIQAARGDYLAFLDDDDVFFPGHLATAHEALIHDMHDLVYLGAVVSPRRLRDLPPDWQSMRVKAYPFNDDFLLVANFIHTGSVVVRNFRTSSIRFDESLTCCEDWDMWLALRHHLDFRVAHVGELSTAYHQVPGMAGLVTRAHSLTPSPFSLARRRIYARWPVKDDVVTHYRQWMTRFDAYCDLHIAGGRIVPAGSFDLVLTYLHDNLTAGRLVDSAVIPELVCPAESDGPG
ncbi:glycosyltransferase family 2 protein [Asanoa siamensis]|uniref:glycosyltransferase family 2 protein n=1 Tax=Asanoa siamensis TaxID=926357 RepID=UPI0019439C35|nr:glycosyltransferase family A protein [Asanoa siamensis]